MFALSSLCTKFFERHKPLLKLFGTPEPASMETMETVPLTFVTFPDSNLVSLIFYLIFELMEKCQVFSTDKLSFEAEWFDPESTMLRKFVLLYFPSDNTLELFDVHLSEVFLKRAHVPGLKFENLYVGSTIIIFTRAVTITGFANEFTREKLGSLLEKTFCLIKPDGVLKKGPIFKRLCAADFKISKLRMINLTHEHVPKVFSSIKDDNEYPFLLNHVTSGPSIAIELVANNAVLRLQELAGPSNPEEAKVEAPGSLRAMFGTSPAQNVIHASASPVHARKELEAMFGPDSPPNDSDTSTCVLENSTCCIIKPHAVKEGKAGAIINDIEAGGFKITAMQTFILDKLCAEEFLEVYNTVVEEYLDMVEEISSGICLALEVTAPHGGECVSEFRELAGPVDPQIGRQVRPGTLRAKYGRNKDKNAVHATDLPEDGVLEVEYFFNILS